MALPHAHPDDVVDLLPAFGAAPAPVSVSLLRTANLQLLRLVLPAEAAQPHAGQTLRATVSVTPEGAEDGNERAVRIDAAFIVPR